METEYPMADVDKFLPLTPTTLHILLTLIDEDRHGYSIMQEVARQSGGQYKPGPGTLYDSLQRMIAVGTVREVGATSSEADSRRRYYRLTALGRAVLTSEIARLEGVVRGAKLSLLGTRPKRV
jgi:DNA-binding PadR family transcriptional regulator